MEKIWLKEYPQGIPAEIDNSEFQSIKEILNISFARFADKPAYTNMDVTLSYGELDSLSQHFAAYLQKVAKLSKGDRVAIMLPNVLQYPVVAFGALRAGMTVVNVNPLYTARELEHQLNDSGAEIIVILENFAHTLADVLPRTSVKTVITTQLGDLFPAPKRLLVNLVVKHVKKMVPAWRIQGAIPLRQILKQGANHTLDDVELKHDDLAFLQYTGGTTGVAKGAMLSHGNMISNLLQAGSWLSVVTEEGKEVVITALPLYHIFSLLTNCLLFLKIGGHNILITNPRDMPGFVKELAKHRFTVITGVNTLFNGLLNNADFAKLDFSSLKLTVGGGMAVQKAVAEQWKRVTSTPLIEAYGLTETSPGACVNPLTLQDYNGSIGLPIPSTSVSIRDEDGNDLPLGEVGEICIHGPQVMQGYWQRPEETAKVLDNGWLRTGDMAIMDEKGYIRIVDRKKDMILVSGFNVYPNEIEDVLAAHPKVLESAAIGVADDKSGEVVKVFIVRKDDSLTANEVIQHCKQNLTGYKVPKQVEFRDELPKTNVGKILRRALRDSEAA